MAFAGPASHVLSCAMEPTAISTAIGAVSHPTPMCSSIAWMAWITPAARLRSLSGTV